MGGCTPCDPPAAAPRPAPPPPPPTHPPPLPVRAAASRGVVSSESDALSESPELTALLDLPPSMAAGGAALQRGDGRRGDRCRWMGGRSGEAWRSRHGGRCGAQATHSGSAVATCPPSLHYPMPWDLCVPPPPPPTHTPPPPNTTTQHHHPTPPHRQTHCNNWSLIDSLLCLHVALDLAAHDRDADENGDEAGACKGRGPAGGDVIRGGMGGVQVARLRRAGREGDGEVRLK